MTAHERLTVLATSIVLSAMLGAVFGGLTAYFLIERSYLVDQIIAQLGIRMEDPSAEQNIVELIRDEAATISVVEHVAPAVVSVVVKKEVSVLNGSLGYPAYEASDSAQGEYVEVGGGTAFFVTTDGLLLTNKHVVADDTARYSIITNDGDEYAVDVIAEDVFLDLAVLKVNAELDPEFKFPIVMLGDSDSLRIGQTVIAIGNTLSEFRNTVTKGVVSGIDRRVVAGDYYVTEVIDEAIQTDAAINPGNSGGPLINLFGEVIGVNTAVSSSGQGVGFAIPIDAAKSVIDDVIEFGRIVRPWLGVRYLMVDAELAAEGGLDSDHGALVISGRTLNDYAVIPGSPAETAGIEEGDIITEIDGIRIDEENPLSDLVNVYSPGDVIEIKLIRAGETLTINATLTELQAENFE
ncbi:MAG: trypsin-like peptidase domain-containing protein [Candidatus Uhrbacteria bacterium]|nr:trypsin-like peptidase domain-containing protein [Patescibacteria group bacterium]MBU1907389.1 trypsin-like peptidase domain-containing protein [Patescibacteria group bacterium]